MRVRFSPPALDSVRADGYVVGGENGAELDRIVQTIYGSIQEPEGFERLDWLD